MKRPATICRNIRKSNCPASINEVILARIDKLDERLEYLSCKTQKKNCT